jgi:hypothetical protein
VHQRNHPGDPGLRHLPDGRRHQGDQLHQDRRHLPDEDHPDEAHLGDPFLAMERKDCFRDAIPGGEFPFPVQMRTGCYPDVEYPELAKEKPERLWLPAR